MVNCNKQKIVFISTSTVFYGAERVLLDIITGLGSKYKIHIVLPGDGPFLTKLKTIPGLSIHVMELPLLIVKPLNLLILLLQMPIITFRFSRLLKQIGADLLYINGMSSLAAAIVARLLNYKSICHIHDKNGEKIDGYMYPLLIKTCCNRVIFISNYVMATYLKRNSSIKNKSAVIYNSTVSIESSSGAGISDQVEFTTFMVVARLEKQKNIIDAIDAIETLNNEGLTSKLLIVGDGTQRSVLQHIVDERGLSGKIELLGYREDTGPYYKLADVVLCPFIGEGFGLVAVEAMAAGKPVIAAADGGLLEIVQDNETGFLYRPGDVEELVLKMKLLLNPKLRDLMASKGKSRAISCFTQKKQIDTIRLEIDTCLKTQ
jgi:glycosyltransferase involved in cell wall biosynthesis